MYFTRSKVGINRKAIAFLSLFILSVLLIKPIHIFTHDHHIDTADELLSTHDKNCEICAFQFSTFASIPSIHIEATCSLHIDKIDINPVFRDIEGLKYVLSLRAPPSL